VTIAPAPENPDRFSGRFIAPGETYATLATEISLVAFVHEAQRWWWIAFLASLALLGIFAASLAALLYEGVGVWGNNIPVTWALDIVSYDWWIGLATGSLLVSALLLLLRQEWRNALNRAAESCALFAAVAAGLYPIVHLGRPWFFYWTLPYPNTLLLWPQFRSPLSWDALAIISYLVVCVTFWYVGMLPDLALLRDRASGLRRRQIYGLLALGWRGSAAHWARLGHAYRSLAMLAIAIVVSLQTGAAVMFAGAVEPGWHDTMLPVAFLLAAAFAGVAAIAMVTVVLRAAFALDRVITAAHLDLLAWLLLGLGLANAYCYAAEFFTTALGGNSYDIAVMLERFGGPYAWAFWLIVVAALLPVQLFWLRPLRRAPRLIFAVSLLVTLGMWADHFMVIVTTLSHDFLPSAEHVYAASVWGIGTFAGSIGLFLALLLLALRYMPVVSLVGVRRLVRPQAEASDG
jgi:molybdopterin-containing oxidoreductase family membrane subunit